MAKRGIFDEDRRPKFRDSKGDPQRAAPGRDAPAPAGPSRQVVFKVIHWHKAARAARDSAAYMGRLRPQDDPADREQVYSAADVALTPEALRAELEAWGLKADGDNLSPEARKADKADRAAMPEEERLNRRQTMHGTLSFPRDGGLTKEQIKEVAAETFRRQFADKGHLYVYAVHEEGEKTHVHVLVKVEGRDNKSRLRLGPKELQAIRRDAAEISNERFGTKYRATKRESRERTREQVRKGQDVLRPKRGYREATGNHPDRSWLRTKAPAWYGRHGADYERRRAAISDGRQVPAPYPARLPELSAKTNKALAQHFARYEQPEVARQRFLELAAESREYAYWAANRRPETFGTVKPDAPKVPALNQERAPVSRSWQTEARRRIADADAQEWQKAPERIAARRQAADTAAKVATAARHQADQRYAESVFARHGHGAAPQPGGGGQSIQPDRDAADGDGQKRPWRDRLRDWINKAKPKDEATGSGQNHMPEPDREGDQRKKPTAQDIEDRAAQLDTRQDHDTGRGPDHGRDAATRHREREDEQ